MRKSKYSVFLSLLFFLFINSMAWADLCGSKNFQGVEKNCIANQEAKMEQLIIPISKFKTGDVYFFKTDLGNFGKIFIHGADAKGNECSLYFDYEVFDGKNKSSISSTASIKNYLGVWNQQALNLDYLKSEPDFFLKHNSESSSKLADRCVLESSTGSIIKAGQYDPTKIDKKVILYIFSILLLGIAVFNISRVVFEEENQFKTSEALNELESNIEVDKNESLILKYSRPFFKRYFLPIVAGMKNKKKITEKYKRLIAASGLTKSMTPVDVYSFKLFLIIGFPVLYLGLREFLETDWPLSFTPVMGVLGFIYPDIWIKSKADQRKKEIVTSLPFVVDMLALSVEAGLDFVAAMTRVLQKAPKSPLIDEFEIVIKEIQLGSTRSQALKQLAWRVDDLPITSFCATLIAADSVGASIGPILKSLAGEIRGKRSSIIEKKGAAAASKMLIPMILFILPAIIVIIFAPMAVQFF